MAGPLAAPASLLFVSHPRMHPTIELNCRLSALFLIDRTREHRSCRLPNFTNQRCVTPRELQLDFVHQTLIKEMIAHGPHRRQWAVGDQHVLEA